MDERDRLIDAALAGLPLAPTPPGFTRRVMAEVWRPLVSFRVEFLDVALPVFFTLFAMLPVAGVLYWILQLDPLTALEWKLSAQLALARLSLWPGVSWVAAGVALGLALLLILTAAVAVRVSEEQ